MPTDDDFDRWFVFKSVDAVATHSFTTEEILAAHARGALRDRTVIHHRFVSRGQSMTVAELVAREKK